MRWLIGPKRIGKTTKLLNVFLQDPRDAFYICPTWARAKSVCISARKICDQNKLYWEATTYNLEININGILKKFVSFDYFQSFNINQEQKNMPKFIDDTDSILQSMFNNVLYASGTGPNLNWANIHSKEMMEKAKNMLPHEVYLTDFTREWE